MATFLKWLQANWFWIVIGGLVVLSGWGIWATLSLGGKLLAAEGIASELTRSLGSANSTIVNLKSDIAKLTGDNQQLVSNNQKLVGVNTQLAKSIAAIRANSREALQILDGSK